MFALTKRLVPNETGPSEVLNVFKFHVIFSLTKSCVNSSIVCNVLNEYHL